MIDDKIKKVSCGGANIAKIVSGGVLVWISESYALNYLNGALQKLKIRTSGGYATLTRPGNGSAGENGRIYDNQDKSINGYPDVRIEYSRVDTTGFPYGDQTSYTDTIDVTLSLIGTKYKVYGTYESNYFGY